MLSIGSAVVPGIPLMEVKEGIRREGKSLCDVGRRK
jgi:hypothetical protein